MSESLANTNLLSPQDKNKLKPSFLLKLGFFVSLPITDTIAQIDKEENDGRLRNIVQEPFDVFDHAGNFNPSMLLAGYPYLLASSTKKVRSSPRLQKGVLGLGVLAAFGANFLAETKTGVKLIGENGTPDTVDMLYGSGAAIVTAGLLYPKGK